MAATSTSPRKMYTLHLTEEDISTIAFVGHRYGWSDTLSSLGEGKNEIPERKAWDIISAFNEDTEGGHSFFPMLNHQSDLARKLFHFMEEIV